MSVAQYGALPASPEGEAVAKIYAAKGCKVLIVDLNEERLRQVEADIKGGHVVCVASHRLEPRRSFGTGALPLPGLQARHDGPQQEFPFGENGPGRPGGPGRLRPRRAGLPPERAVQEGHHLLPGLLGGRPVPESVALHEGVSNPRVDRDRFVDAP